jgi:uncharacterized small protein (DUF1192 family)
MISGVTQDLSTLLRGEIELAKAELRDSARNAGKGGGLLAGAAVFGFVSLLFLFATLAWVLNIWLPTWAAWLIVTVLLLIITAVLALVGKKQLDSIKAPVALQEDIEKTKAALQRKPGSPLPSAMPAPSATASSGTAPSAGAASSALPAASKAPSSGAA